MTGGDGPPAPLAGDAPSAGAAARAEDGAPTASDAAGDGMPASDGSADDAGMEGAAREHAAPEASVSGSAEPSASGAADVRAGAEAEAGTYGGGRDEAPVPSPTPEGPAGETLAPSGADGASGDDAASGDGVAGTMHAGTMHDAGEAGPGQDAEAAGGDPSNIAAPGLADEGEGEGAPAETAPPSAPDAEAGSSGPVATPGAGVAVTDVSFRSDADGTGLGRELADDAGAGAAPGDASEDAQAASAAGAMPLAPPPGPSDATDTPFARASTDATDPDGLDPGGLDPSLRPPDLTPPGSGSSETLSSRSLSSRSLPSGQPGATADTGPASSSIFSAAREDVPPEGGAPVGASPESDSPERAASESGPLESGIGALAGAGAAVAGAAATGGADAMVLAGDVATDPASGPIAGRLPPEGLPDIALVGPNGDPVLDPASAMPLGGMAGDAPNGGAGAAGGVATAFAAGSALSLASGGRAGPDASSAGAPGEGGIARGGLDPSLFERPDYVPGERVGTDVTDPGAPGPSSPPASTLASNADRMPHPADLDRASLDPVALDAAGGASLDAAGAGAPGADAEIRLPTAGDFDPLDTERSTSAIRPTDDGTRLAGTVPEADGAPGLATRTASGGTAPDASGTMPPPRPAPARQPVRRRGRGGMWATLGVVAAAGAGGWFLRDELADATGVEGFRTAFGLEQRIDGLVDRDAGDEGPTDTALNDDGLGTGEEGTGEDTAGPLDPADPAPDDGADPDVDVAALDPADGADDAADADSAGNPDDGTTVPVDDGAIATPADGTGGDDGTAPADAPDGSGTPDTNDVAGAASDPVDADPEITVEAEGPEKFSFRLNPDGTETEIDVATRDTDVTSRPVPVTPVDGNGDPLPGEVAPAPGGDDAAGAAGEADARSFLVAEPLGGVDAAPNQGGVAWSVVSERPGANMPPEPAIRGNVTLEDGTQLSVTVRRNADATLPASHLIELVFDLPEGGESTIQSLPLVGFKDSLEVSARPLVAVPAKITDAYFLVGLNNLPTAVKSNLDLMRAEDFMDVQLVYGNGRRATLTIEKGTRGDEVFEEVLTAWNEAPLPG